MSFPPSRYSQLRRWVNAGQAMLWSTWLSNPDILEVPDVVPDCFAGGASGDSHIFDRYRFGNQRGERGRGRPDNRDPGGGDRRGVHRHLSAVRRSCPGISGAQRPRGGISRPVRAYLDRRCRLIHGRRGRRRLASAGFAAGAAQRHQCTHPGAVGTPVDRRRHRCGAGERGAGRGRRHLDRQRRDRRRQRLSRDRPRRGRRGGRRRRALRHRRRRRGLAGPAVAIGGGRRAAGGPGTPDGAAGPGGSGGTGGLLFGVPGPSGPDG